MSTQNGELVGKARIVLYPKLFSLRAMQIFHPPGRILLAFSHKTASTKDLNSFANSVLLQFGSYVIILCIQQRKCIHSCVCQW